MQTIEDCGSACQPLFIDSDSPDGLLVLGENTKVLSSIGPTVDGMVRCVYMDPPYRNGESYTHYDDAKTHEQWLAYMASLLPRIWSLLSEDGSVWISIDDAEMAYLKVLCDLHFGRDSYQATVVWQHRTTRENRASFSHSHEYILVYVKNPSKFKKTRNKIVAPELLERYKNPDNDPRGPWQSITATAQSGHAVASQFYAITSPKTGKDNYPPKGRCWIYSKQRMLKEIEKGNIWFGIDGNGAPRIKKFLANSMPEIVPDTLWTAEDVGTTLMAKKQLLGLFPEDEIEVFETPKPESLLERILYVATNPGDIVLDPFLGSGTTAAVAQKMNRKYIGIDNSSASLSFARRRMNKVFEGERSGISRKIGWKGGGCCKAYELTNDGLKLIA